MQNPIPDFLEILKILADNKVDFIVVGGVCAVLHGAPVTTFDLDLVHSRVSSNLDRLMSALRELDSYYREREDIRITPGLSHLSSPGHQLLMTRFGPLDLLGTVGKGHNYEDLLEHSEEIQVSGYNLRILSLEKLIMIKEEVVRDRDKTMLPILRHTLREKRKH
jgi:predicted nucleotidyltransferase